MYRYCNLCVPYAGKEKSYVQMTKALGFHPSLRYEYKLRVVCCMYVHMYVHTAIGEAQCRKGIFAREACLFCVGTSKTHRRVWVGEGHINFQYTY